MTGFLHMLPSSAIKLTEKHIEGHFLHHLVRVNKLHQLAGYPFHKYTHSMIFNNSDNIAFANFYFELLNCRMESIAVAAIIIIGGPR
jgi:hypothetical protein